MQGPPGTGTLRVVRGGPHCVRPTLLLQSPCRRDQCPRAQRGQYIGRPSVRASGSDHRSSRRCPRAATTRRRAPERKRASRLETCRTNFPVCNIWKGSRFLHLSESIGRREMEYGDWGLGTGESGLGNRRSGLSKMHPVIVRPGLPDEKVRVSRARVIPPGSRDRQTQRKWAMFARG